MCKLISKEEYKEKSSKFITLLYKIDNYDDFKSIYGKIKVEYKKADHILKIVRYKNKFDVLIDEYSEDKEPISSMKRLSEISKINNYKDFALFIVRYFGGTKMGASNLDRFYFQIGVNQLNKLKGEENGR